MSVKKIKIMALLVLTGWVFTACQSLNSMVHQEDHQPLKRSVASSNPEESDPHALEMIYYCRKSEKYLSTLDRQYTQETNSWKTIHNTSSYNPSRRAAISFRLAETTGKLAWICQDILNKCRDYVTKYSQTCYDLRSKDI